MEPSAASATLCRSPAAADTILTPLVQQQQLQHPCILFHKVENFHYLSSLYP